MKSQTSTIALLTLFSMFFVVIDVSFGGDTMKAIKIDLVPTSGEKYYSGKSDCRASSEIAVDSANIHISILVEDDDFFFTNDPIRSDHVEVWIAIPESKNHPYSYIMSSDSALWLVGQTADVKKFNAEVKDPLISSSLFEDDVRYHMFDTLDGGGVKEDVDFELENARKGENKKIHVLFGQSHFGFLPDNKMPLQYDREFIRFIERGTNTIGEDLCRSVHYTVEKESHSYRMSISIPASSLVFFDEKSTKQLRFLIDVIDIDKSGKEQTVLSSSKTRRWADVNTYNTYDITTVLCDPSLLNQFPPGSLPGIERPVYFNTTSGWVPIKRNQEQVVYPHRLRYHSLPNLEIVDFVLGESGFQTDTLDGKIIRIYSAGDPYSTVGREDFVLFPDGKIFTTEQFIDAFRFPSGKLGVVIGKYDFYMGGCFASGMCGCNIEAGLFIRRDIRYGIDDETEDSDNDLLLAHWSGCGYYVEFNDSLRFDDGEHGIDFGGSIHGEGVEEHGSVFNWKQIFNWKKIGERMVFDLGKKIKIEAILNEKQWKVLHHRLY